MREPVILIWRRRGDVAIFSVEASPTGTPRLVQQNDLEPGVTVIGTEQHLLDYLDQGRTELVAVTLTVAYKVLGWEL